MYDFYDKPISDSDWQRARKAIRRLYGEIPETEGCLVNIAKENGCGSWCCEFQSPSLFYSEFLYAWKQVEEHWPKEKVIKLYLRCVESHLSKATTKGCVFWDRSTKLCGIHEQRPYNCRSYGQIPQEEFKPRYERLKILYENDPTAVVRDQCNLVTSPKPPTKKDNDEWFKELHFIERDIGVHPSLMNDQNGGSYRQFHDHILLKTSSEAFLEKLKKLRDGTATEKAKFVEEFKKELERDLK